MLRSVVSRRAQPGPPSWRRPPDLSAVTPQASEWWSALASALKDLGDKYGPFSVLLILFLVFFVWYTHRLWTGRLRDKDKEIERLVLDRNRLQEIILSNRLTSRGKSDD